jgi:hypothetical protein
MSSPSTLLHHDGHPALRAGARRRRAGRCAWRVERYALRVWRMIHTPAPARCRRAATQHAQPHRAAEPRATAFSALLVVPRDHERRAGLAREPRQAHSYGGGEGRSRVDDDQSERTTPQQDVGAPRRSRGIPRTNHPQSLSVAQMRPVAWRERPGGIDVRHPTRPAQRFLHQSTEQRRHPAPLCSHDLCEPASRKATPAEHRIQLLEPRRKRGGNGGRRRDEGGRRREEIDERLREHREWRARAAPGPTAETATASAGEITYPE